MQYPFLAAPSFLRPVAIFAGVSSSIQATVYIVLTILGILVYECKITVPDDLGSFQRCVVEMYFHESATCADRHFVFSDLLPPETTFAWIVAYLVMDVLWLLVSIALTILVIRFKKNCIVGLFTWSILTLAVCCMDLAGLVYYALQLQAVTFKAATIIDSTAVVHVNDICSDVNTMLLVPGLLMTIAGRFYLFWLLNAALVVIIGVCAIGMYSRASEDQESLDNSAMSPFFLDPVESVNSITFGRRLSVIDAWKSSWKDSPPIHIPKVKTLKKPPFTFPKYDSGPSSETTESFPQHIIQSSIMEEIPGPSSPIPVPPEPPTMPPPPTEPSSAPERKGPPPPKRHPPPPPDLKPLRSALKPSDYSRTGF